jgi:hypothetical protein
MPGRAMTELLLMVMVVIINGGSDGSGNKTFYKNLHLGIELSTKILRATVSTS